MSRIKKSFFGVLMAAFAVTFCSCGKKEKVDYEILQSETDATEQEVNGVYADVDTSVKWSDEFDVPGAGGVIIDAETDISGMDSLSVISVSFPEFDSDYKKNMAEKIFGNSTVYVYGIEAPTRADLETEIETLKNRIDINVDIIGDENEAGADNEAEFIDDLKNENQFYSDLIEKYEDMLEAAPEGRTATADYSEYNFIAEKNGVNFTLKFIDSSVAAEDEYISALLYDPTRYTYMRLAPENYGELCPDSIKNEEGEITCYAASEDMTDENICSITQEDAELTVKQFVNSLGFSGYEVTKTLPLAWYNYVSEDEVLTAIDGYSVSLEPMVDGISLSEDEYSYDLCFAYDDSGDGTHYGTNYDVNSDIMVFVTDDGVVGMFTENLFIITDVTENVPVISLDNVKDIMEDALKNDYDTYVQYQTGHSVKFKNLTLKYFRLKDDTSDDAYSFVPAWQLSDSKVDMQYCVVVNAIDGSVIDVGKEIYGVTNE